MDGKKCGTFDFRLGGRRLTHIRTQKIDAFLRQMALRGAFTIIFTLTFWSPGVDNIAGARLWRFRTASVHKICSWRWKLSRFSENLIFSEIKLKMKDVFGQMREEKRNAGFPARLRDGWHLWNECHGINENAQTSKRQQRGCEPGLPPSINSFHLIPTETAFRGSPSYRPISPSSVTPLTGRNRPPGWPPKPCAWINPFLSHIKRWRYIHRRCRRRSQIISAHVGRFHSRISGWFIQFLLSLLLHSFTFWRLLPAAWQQWKLDSNSDGFVTVGFGENEHFAVALGSGSDVD